MQSFKIGNCVKEVQLIFWGLPNTSVLKKLNVCYDSQILLNKFI